MQRPADSQDTARTPFVAYLLPGLILLFGALATVGGALEIVDGLDSALWPITEGVVIHSEVEQQRSADRTTTDSGVRAMRESTYVYSADVRYRYSVGDEDHEGNTVHFGEYASGDPARAEEIVSRYPVGKSIPVRYSPANPAYSVLESGLTTSSIVITLIGLGLLGLGILLAFKFPPFVRRVFG